MIKGICRYKWEILWLALFAYIPSMAHVSNLMLYTVNLYGWEKLNLTGTIYFLQFQYKYNTRLEQRDTWIKVSDMNLYLVFPPNK